MVINIGMCVAKMQYYIKRKLRVVDRILWSPTRPPLKGGVLPHPTLVLPFHMDEETGQGDGITIFTLRGF